uniref:Uncharacterized protein n=1 Tax=Avena sativa TaxID=4498 RepID=A0ACD5YJV7_AVESA
MDKVTRRGENRSSKVESFLKKLKLESEMIKEEKDEEQRYREIPEPPPATVFEPEKFGDGAGLDKLSKSLSQYALVSVALFNGDVLLYACSGTAVCHWHGNIKGYHKIFVTSVRLAHKFNDNRTREDKLRIELRTSDNETLHGFLGLYDEKNGIAIVTSLSLEVVCTMDTSDPVDLPQGTLANTLFAFGCATDGTLLGANCSHPVVKNQALVSGYGGPVMYCAPGGSPHLAGLIIRSDNGKITLLPTKKLHNRLKCFLKITRWRLETGGGRKRGIGGFMVEAKILQSLGYPLPPPLLFELNGRLAGRFEEHFGELHYWEGYPFDSSYNDGENPVWDQLGERLAQEIFQSVVSIASFKGDVYSYNKRCFACTGLLITGRHCPFVLTSASLVRTGDADGEIDENLRIDVFLPRNHTVLGTLRLYHQNYNIAIVHLQQNLGTDTCPQDILNVRESIGRPSIGRAVVAIGRATKGCHGLLMASMGKVKGKYKVVTEGKNKQCLAKKLDCQELLLSTCQIKKVGIGGPLIGLDGSFIGMNFYDESKTTSFLPRKKILTVLREGFDLLERKRKSPCTIGDGIYIREPKDG